MLHIPNLTQGQCQSLVMFAMSEWKMALQCQNAKMAVRNSGDCYWPKSIKSATI
jgi:hypothetical protein